MGTNKAVKELKFYSASYCQLMKGHEHGEVRMQLAHLLIFAEKKSEARR